MSILRYSVAIIFLATLFFSCNDASGPAASNAAASGSTTAANTGLKIVHVKSDSLRTGYLALAQEFDRLEANVAKAQENLTAEGNALQKEVAGLQNKAQQGLLSPNQIQSEQQRIARKEQEIMQRRDVAMNSIQQEELELQARFAEKVKEILEELKAEFDYDYILNQGAGSGVLISDDAHDITDLVLKRLNAADAPVKEETEEATTTEADN